MDKEDKLSSYVMVFAGSRDHYQSAIALSEVGSLHALVNEFYIPALPPWARWVCRHIDWRGKTRARKNDALPAHLVEIIWSAFLLTILNRVWPSTLFGRWKDAVLGDACGNIACRANVPLLAYSYYASYAFERAPSDLLRIIFQVHPHPDTVRRILTEELRRSPWARRSLSNEHELNLPLMELGRLSREALEAHYVITPSTFAKKSLVDANVRADRIAVVPYGIDTAVFKPKVFTAPVNRTLRLLFVGSIVQRKGLGYLFQAMQLLQGEPVELTIVGRGARDDVMLKHFADVPCRLIWNAPRDDLVREMQAADLFVFPSLAESFAHVILEAMSVGLPVITTNNTAGPDLLGDGHTGFVGGIRDIDFLVDKIRWFLANRDAIPVMGRSCQEEAARRTWPRFRFEFRQALSGFEHQRKNHQWSQESEAKNNL